uniref:Transcriptional regulator n=1 Tax=Brugia timori TaxID=42155 RepID=A0A0R3QKR3_9BILA
LSESTVEDKSKKTILLYARFKYQNRIFYINEKRVDEFFECLGEKKDVMEAIRSVTGNVKFENTLNG